jgi:hypothetical protein
VDDGMLRGGLTDRPVAPLALALLDDLERAADADEADLMAGPQPDPLVEPAALEEDVATMTSRPTSASAAAVRCIPLTSRSPSGPVSIANGPPVRPSGRTYRNTSDQSG